MITTKEEALELIYQESNKIGDIDPYYCDRNTYFALDMCSEDLRNDIDIVSRAIALDTSNAKYANKKIFNNVDNMMKIIDRWPSCYDLAGDKIKNEKYYLKCIERNPDVYRHLPNEMQKEEKYFLKYFEEKYKKLKKIPRNERRKHFYIMNDVISDYVKNLNENPSTFSKMWEIINKKRVCVNKTKRLLIREISESTIKNNKEIENLKDEFEGFDPSKHTISKEVKTFTVQDFNNLIQVSEGIEEIYYFSSEKKMEGGYDFLCTNCKTPKKYLSAKIIKIAQSKYSIDIFALIKID